MKRLVEHLQLNPADKLLDACTGTGCVALAAAEKLTEGKVTGIWGQSKNIITKNYYSDPNYDNDHR